MHDGWWLIPVFSAITGWLAVWIVTLIFLRYAQTISLGSLIGRPAGGFFSVKDLAGGLTSAENVKKIMPYAETHIDEFLRVRLVQKMPVIGMFIGDKTIHELKTVFLAELEELFPVIMSNYIGNLEQDFSLGEAITEKLNAIPGNRVKELVKTALSRQLNMAMVAGAATGLVTGLLQLGLMSLIKG